MRAMQYRAHNTNNNEPYKIGETKAFQVHCRDAHINTQQKNSQCFFSISRSFVQYSNVGISMIFALPESKYMQHARADFELLLLFFFSFLCASMTPKMVHVCVMQLMTSDDDTQRSKQVQNKQMEATQTNFCLIKNFVFCFWFVCCCFRERESNHVSNTTERKSAQDMTRNEFSGA